MRLDIGRVKINQEKQHQEDVYNTLYSKGRLTAKKILQSINNKYDEDNKRLEKDAEEEVKKGNFSSYFKDKYLRENWKHPIGIRTVQRCLARDPRIGNDGRYYFIDKKAIFEKRYLYPKEFGERLYTKFIAVHLPPADGNDISPSETEWLEHYLFGNFMNRIQAFILFMFIEAAKPFKDKSLTMMDKAELVDYWIENAIPIKNMCLNFTHIMNYFQLNFDRDKQMNKTLWREISQELITKTYRVMKRKYPEMYRELYDLAQKYPGKRTTPSKTTA